MKLSLKVYFDFSCPYCYLAWGYMKKVKQERAIDDVWIGWEIHPQAPKEGSEIQVAMPSVNLADRLKKLNDLGAPVEITPGNNTFRPNTHLALAALEYATEKGKMHVWIDAVYQASYVVGVNIGDQAVLLKIATNLGLDADELASRLAEGYYNAAILAHDKECMDKKLEWVPTVYRGDEKVIEGAFTYGEFQEKILALR